MSAFAENGRSFRVVRAGHVEALTRTRVPCTTLRSWPDVPRAPNESITTVRFCVSWLQLNLVASTAVSCAVDSLASGSDIMVVSEAVALVCDQLALVGTAGHPGRCNVRSRDEEST
jgi:hypothetical protein